MSFLGRNTPPLLVCNLILALSAAFAGPLYFAGNLVPALLCLLLGLFLIVVVLWVWWRGDL